MEHGVCSNIQVSIVIVVNEASSYQAGIRSDSDLYTFGFSWRPWSEAKAIAKGELIREYVTESARMYGIDKKIRFHHQVNAANYSSTEKRWQFDVNANGKPASFSARFMLLCTGYYDYNTPLESTIPGIENYKGTTIHPQFWPKELDWTDKEVVVVGSGATAVTVVPTMAEKAKHVTMLQRSPGYIVSIPTEDATEWVLRRTLWWWPGLQHFLFRAKWILTSLVVTTLCQWFPKVVKHYLLERTRRILPKTIKTDPHFNPRYYPWQQRMCLCPDADFFLALKSGKASIETGVIDTVTPNSIKLQSGVELNPDIIVTATGIKLQFAGGIKVSVDEKPVNLSEKFIWKGLMIEDVPNSAFSFGYVDASWTLGADASAQLVCRLITRMQKQGVAEVTPRTSDEEKQKMQVKSLLRLNSSYVTKSASLVPRNGDSGQWIPRSHYMRDMWNAWYGDIQTSLDWVSAD